MNELAKETADSITEAVNELPHQQMSPEVLRLVIAAQMAVAILKIKFSK